VKKAYTRGFTRSSLDKFDEEIGSLVSESKE
jgi:hypothetical protein